MSPVEKNRPAAAPLANPDGPTEFAEVSREFAEILPDGVPEADRRRFLKLMGASLALAGASGCHPSNPTWPPRQT